MIFMTKMTTGSVTRFRDFVLYNSEREILRKIYLVILVVYLCKN
jgi:hypothetical protein